VAVTPEITVDREQLHQAVLQSTQAFGVNAPSAIAIVDIDSLPKTATGKIQRQQLADWYQSQPLEAVAHNPPPSHLTSIQAAFCQALNLRHVHPDDTFVTLGGDSLSYVQFSMALERSLGYLPPNWEQLSLSDLEHLTPRRSRFGAIESTILFRALAICGVVITHTPFLAEDTVGGGATLLLMIAGLNFARFQGEALLRGQVFAPLLSLFRNLLVPYFVIAVLYQLHRREFNAPVLLLVSNFIDPEVTSIFPVWFIQVLAQCVILFTIPFTVRSLRSFAQSQPWVFGYLCFIVWVAIAWVAPYLWNTDHLYNRMPYLSMWLITLGWMLHFAHSKTQKILSTLFFVVVAVLVLPADRPSETIWMLGTLVILWLPDLPVPHRLKHPIQLLSAAAYSIYLTHMIFIHILAKALNIRSPLLIFAIALLAGSLIWMALQTMQRWISDRQFAR
jgi:membrane-bound acyltransferase YfiQ involved in biofilm formation/acyl carrier protein